MDYEYQFKGIDGLRCDMKGNFALANEPIKKQWRAGQVFVKVGYRRYGIKTLRKLAYKTESIQIPF